ncbi:CoA ester lyase [Erythrobacteraceae bacterium WH01K]|nr:CoA ester lyase [Erythrobacteraceae bacterium WH01K]
MGKALRSWLVVPADEPAKLEKVAALDADVVLLDLSGVAEDAKSQARQMAADYLTGRPSPAPGMPGSQRWVRINPMGSAHWREDLVAVMPAAPNGIVLPRATGPEQVAQLASEIYELEQTSPAEHNSVRIVPQLGDTAAGALSAPDVIREPHPRLAGLAWDADALMHSAGLRPFGKGARRWPATVNHVRAQVVLAARAAGLFALETGSHVTKDADVFRALASEARSAGFDAMMARHPAQIRPIADIFSPTEEERARARLILDAFERQPEAQVVSVDRFAADRSELARARTILGE